MGLSWWAQELPWLPFPEKCTANQKEERRFHRPSALGKTGWNDIVSVSSRATLQWSVKHVHVSACPLVSEPRLLHAVCVEILLTFNSFRHTTSHQKEFWWCYICNLCKKINISFVLFTALRPGTSVAHGLYNTENGPSHGGRRDTRTLETKGKENTRLRHRAGTESWCYFSTQSH